MERAVVRLEDDCPEAVRSRLRLRHALQIPAAWYLATYLVEVGAFPAEFKRQEDAILFAEEMYRQIKEAYDAKLSTTLPSIETWADVCDAYLTDVENRIHAKPSTRHELTYISRKYLKGSSLSKFALNKINESACVDWLRHLARRNIAKTSKPAAVLHPNSVRNVAKVLRDLFKVAIMRGWISGLVMNPTMGYGFTAELKRLAKKCKDTSQPLPTESFVKLVSSAQVPLMRRVLYLVAGLGGLRPGEVYGLQVRHVQEKGGVPFLKVTQQLQPRKGGGDEILSTKTEDGNREVPLHPLLRPLMKEWLDAGWTAFVGREPTPEDYLFPREDGTRYRVVHGKFFRKDLKLTGCPTTLADKPAKPYSMRKMFSTALMEGEAAPAAHDYLMGHASSSLKYGTYSAKRLPFLETAIKRIVLPGLEVVAATSAVTTASEGSPAPPSGDRGPNRGPSDPPQEPAHVTDEPEAP